MPMTPATTSCPRCSKTVIQAWDSTTGDVVYLEPDIDLIGLELLNDDGTTRRKTVREAAKRVPGHHEHLRPGHPRSSCRLPPAKPAAPQPLQESLFA